MSQTEKFELGLQGEEQPIEDDSLGSDEAFMDASTLEKAQKDDKRVIELNSNIVGFRVVDQDTEKAEVLAKLESMGRHLKPKTLNATRYEIDPRGVNYDESYYIIISDVVLNKDTEHEEMRPYEIFINSLDSGNAQFTNALAVLISGIFQGGGDVNFVIGSLQKIADPAGGWMRPPEEGETKGKYVKSLVSAIGDTLEKHFIKIGMINDGSYAQEVNDSFSEYEQAESHSAASNAADKNNEELSVCPKCSVAAVKHDEGCPTCTSCGYSSCG